MRQRRGSVHAETSDDGTKVGPPDTPALLRAPLTARRCADAGRGRRLATDRSVNVPSVAVSPLDTSVSESAIAPP